MQGHVLVPHQNSYFYLCLLACRLTTYRSKIGTVDLWLQWCVPYRKLQ